jgi:hypothetical protein
MTPTALQTHTASSKGIVNVKQISSSMLMTPASRAWKVSGELQPSSPAPSSSSSSIYSVSLIPVSDK